MGQRELVVLLSLSSWCLVIVVWLFPAVLCFCLQFVIVDFPGHTHLLILFEYDKSHHMRFDSYRIVEHCKCGIFRERFIFAKYAKFRENKIIVRWRNHSVVY